MRALVTGAGGFLGSHICRQLKDRDYDVVGLGRHHYPALDALGVAQIRADITCAAQVRQAMPGVDIVVHTAAIAGVWGPRSLFESINVRGTENIIAACREHGVPKLVYTSSPSVTFEGDDQCHVDESAPYARRWLCEYPRSKALAEQAVLAANGPELATCALRPHLIWGPGDPHLVPRLLARAKAGRLRRIGDGHNVVDVVYVDNAAEAHCLAAEVLKPGSPVAGSAYFISQGDPVNCWEWIERVLSFRQLRLPARGLSFRQAWHLGAACELIYRAVRLPGEPPMTRFVAAQLAKSHYFAIQRARDQLGYQPRISTEEGLGRLASWLSSG